MSRRARCFSRLIPARSRQRWTRPRGDWNQYEATLKKYKLDVERYTPLVKTGSVSRKQLDDALQQVQETEAAIATAKPR